MRILHVLDHSVPLQSGYAFRTLAILKQQEALGWHTDQLTSAKHYGTNKLEECVDGFRFYRTPLSRYHLDRIPVLKQFQVILGLEKRLEELIPTLRPDILHAHSPALNGAATLRASRRHGIPVVYEVRAFWEDAAVDHGTSKEKGVRYRLTRALETFVLKRADAVTVICEGLRKEIVGRGVPPVKVTVVPNAVDLPRLLSAKPSNPRLAEALGVARKKVIGFIGSFYAYEGISLLLETIPQLLKERPDVCVLLVGGGPQENELRALAETTGISDKVIFAGRVPHDEVGAYYDLMDVLVYPRFSMPLTELVTPLKPLEGMARQRPVVASDVGGHRELIKDGQNGRLFKAGDKTSLYRVVLDVLRDEAARRRMTGAGFEFVRSRRNWRVCVSGYCDVYGRLSSSRTEP